MANYESSEILIDLADEVLVRGESVRVPIVLRLVTGRRVRSVVAKFRGAAETKATYTTQVPNGKGQMTTQVQTAVECDEIVNEEWVLAGQQGRGFFGTCWDIVATVFGGGKHVQMKAGDYEYEVEVLVPWDGAATHTGKVSRVFYELRVRVDVALGRDVKFCQSFEVLPKLSERDEVVPVQVKYPDDAGRGFWSELFKPEIKMELVLDRDWVARGGTIGGRFRVDTEEHLEVRKAEVRLVGYEKSTAQGHRDSFRFEGEAVALHVPRMIAPSWSAEFEVLAEAEGPMSGAGKLFSMEWFVEIRLDVPWAKDPVIRAPLELC